MNEERRERLRQEAEGARRAKLRHDTIDEVKADLADAKHQLARMCTDQHRSQEEYHGTTRRGDNTRISLRKRVDYLTRILELIEPQT